MIQQLCNFYFPPCITGQNVRKNLNELDGAQQKSSESSKEIRLTDSGTDAATKIRIVGQDWAKPLGTAYPDNGILLWDASISITQ